VKEYLKCDDPNNDIQGEGLMYAKSVSAAFTTEKVSETRDFYIKYFNAKVTFDCGWYVNLEFGNPSATLQFMSPQKPEHQLSTGAGLIYNFAVDDVDYEYKKLTKAGLDVTVPLEDHPWGDRGFAVQDINGISLYLYSEREPSGEFKQYYKKKWRYGKDRKS
jgi:uncharacterized glyoxalase superfamily protein PhnB